MVFPSVFSPGGLFPGWSSISHQVVFHQVVSHQGCFSGLCFIRVVFPQGGFSLVWPLMKDHRKPNPDERSKGGLCVGGLSAGGLSISGRAAYHYALGVFITPCVSCFLLMQKSLRPS